MYLAHVIENQFSILQYIHYLFKACFKFIMTNNEIYKQLSKMPK